MNKKSDLWISLIGVGLFFIAMYPVNMGICDKSSYDCRKTSDSMQMILGIFSFIFILSLITYKMREEVFQAWWKFARWFVPLIMLVTFLLNSQNRGGGMSATISSGFDILVIGIFYTIFIITSAVKIVQTHKQFK